MLQLRSLIQATPSDIVDGSRKVSSRIIKAIVDADEEGEHKKVIVEARGSSKPYNLVFKFYDLSKKNLANSRVYVHCNCPYFIYYLEVAVAARGSSSVINSNGQYPRVRNSDMRPYLCKHLLQASKGAMKVTPESKQPGDLDQHEIDRLLSIVDDVIPD